MEYITHNAPKKKQASIGKDKRCMEKKIEGKKKRPQRKYNTHTK